MYVLSCSLQKEKEIFFRLLPSGISAKFSSFKSLQEFIIKNFYVCYYLELHDLSKLIDYLFLFMKDDERGLEI